jgi:uncharacterized membrane protein
MLVYKTVLLIIFYFGFPIILIYATQKISFLNKIGVVALAYIFGLLVGNIGIFPRASEQFKLFLGGDMYMPANEAEKLFAEGAISTVDLVANQVVTLQDTIYSVVILLAIPLLLFSLDIKKWLKIAKEALLSLVLAITSLLLAIFIGYYFYKDLIDESWKVSGMLVGVYTGGTPNLAAISTALEINSTTFLLTHTYDLVTGVMCFVFLMTIAQRLFNRFLPSFQQKHAKYAAKLDLNYNEDMINFIEILTKYRILELTKAFGFASIIVAISGGLSLLVPKHSQMATIILSITTLGLLFSNWKTVNKIRYSFQLGMYLIIVFSLVVASMANLYDMFHIEYLHLFNYVALVLFGSIFIHVLLSKIFNIDSDTTIITITALAYSPPFVPVVAGALKNKNIIISGLTIGILGYALGNYLGIAIAYFLQ